jgi:hypothetical protein
VATQAWQVPFIAGGLARLAYGAGAMLAPEQMAKHRIAPRLHGKPDPRMNLRGFGGAQSAIALYSLSAARTRDGARRVLWLNVLTDGLDTVVSAMEGRARGRIDRIVAGGLGINVAALAVSGLAALALRRG